MGTERCPISTKHRTQPSKAASALLELEASVARFRTPTELSNENMPSSRSEFHFRLVRIDQRTRAHDPRLRSIPEFRQRISGFISDAWSTESTRKGFYNPHSLFAINSIAIKYKRGVANQSISGTGLRTFAGRNSTKLLDDVASWNSMAQFDWFVIRVADRDVFSVETMGSSLA